VATGQLSEQRLSQGIRVILAVRVRWLVRLALKLCGSVVLIAAH
jgi:hypothetical protein